MRKKLRKLLGADDVFFFSLRRREQDRDQYMKEVSHCVAGWSLVRPLLIAIIRFLEKAKSSNSFNLLV